MHRIGLRVFDYNRRAIRCYEKVGFRVEGRLREARFIDGEWFDEVWMGLLENEFRAADGPLPPAHCQEGLPSEAFPKV